MARYDDTGQLNNSETARVSGRLTVLGEAISCSRKDGIETPSRPKSNAVRTSVISETVANLAAPFFLAD